MFNVVVVMVLMTFYNIRSTELTNYFELNFWKLSTISITIFLLQGDISDSDKEFLTASFGIDDELAPRERTNTNQTYMSDDVFDE